ncbi:hypothetical protein CAPTEDRAFT_166427 [Capitella teleta]|uniref:non-specific serine/threonine protein kinase n=1 Tax=Capitella teleta TaxID=283909 RepID=R7TUL3_CAPTE|nr:hypothetical protein CAPTEDRAFT_166427 [Capitella teleta]|eukprot:ELT97354.1 hypothetical protein CAPTEDRAFT_166427 [Capitella teleta]
MPRAKASASGDAASAIPKVKRGPKAHALAKPLPAGEILTDVTKKGHWKLIKTIGQGGFGLIYLAKAEHETSKLEYVVKLEPYGNGPLFCELNFFRRAGKPEMISAFMKAHKMKHLGVPRYVASGTHQDNKYRFMVMPKFGTDLQVLFESSGKVFSEGTVYNLGVQMIDALEYIHKNEFVHADIKASNILLDGDNKAFLVDYGLASRFLLNDKHRDYKEDPRKAHDGTIEFTSRDAHRGVAPSRRGDFEILAYCLLQWRCSRLPWEDKLSNKDYVAQQKIKYLDDLPSLFKKCFPGGDIPVVLKQFFQYVVKMEYNDTPDYNFCRRLFEDGIKKIKATLGKLDFGSKSSPKKAVKKAKSKSTDESDVESPPQRKPVKKVVKARTPRTPAMKANGATTPAENGDCVPNHVKALPKGYRAPKRPSPVAATAKLAKKPRQQALKVDEGTQTSPGLKGLRRSQRSR